MKTYISILRGINVSGQRMIKMDALQKMYTDLNFKNIQTYIQSGNVIFQYSKLVGEDLAIKISNQIQKYFGFEVPVIILETEELKEIIHNNPFINNITKNPLNWHITFLSSKPEQIDIKIINQKKADGEEFILTEKAVYLYCPNGYGKCKLTNTFLENKLKVGATTRNWKTVNELFNIAEKISKVK